LRWVLFDIGKDTYFMYQGIFDTDFDKYTEDAVSIFTQTGLRTVFENRSHLAMSSSETVPSGSFSFTFFVSHFAFSFNTSERVRRARNSTSAEVGWASAGLAPAFLEARFFPGP
jgi:hypothetical protein